MIPWIVLVFYRCVLPCPGRGQVVLATIEPSLTSILRFLYQLRLLTEGDTELHMMGCIAQVSADADNKLYRTILSPL